MRGGLAVRGLAGGAGGAGQSKRVANQTLITNLLRSIILFSGDGGGGGGGGQGRYQ